MELFRALGALAEPPSNEAGTLARLLDLGDPPRPGEYEELFVFQLYPYASVYLGAEGKLGGEARDRIAGFWRALEIEPPTEPDHLALMLGLHARLAELEAAADRPELRQGWRHARKAWLWEHLLSWLPTYLSRIEELGGGFYRAWGRTLGQALVEEASDLGPPVETALHLRQAPPLADPRQAPAEDAGAAFIDEILSPVRTGFVLLAADLQRSASDLKLGLRAGERRFVLKALLSQDAAGTLGWLADYAASSARRSDSRPEVLTPATGFWGERARASARLLGELASDAGYLSP